MGVRIFNLNYIDPDVVSNVFPSSEAAAFPVENIQNRQRRSKVWRSAGFFKIVSGDNTIVFRETTGGPDLTATVAAGEYTSLAALNAALKSAFEAAGDSTYTVSQSVTTLKTVIASNGSGGGGVLILKWTHANSADMAAILGYDTASDDSGSLSYEADFLRIHTEERITFDFGISTNIMSFLLIGRRNGNIQISPTATLKLQASETNVWNTPNFSTNITHDDEVIYHIDEDFISPTAERYWSFQMVDKDNPNGYLEIGAMLLGDFFQTDQGVVHFPLSRNFVDRSETVFSQGGQTFANILEKTERFRLSYSHLSKTEVEEFETFFKDVGTSVPFFIQLDPSSVFSSAANRLIRFVKFEREPAPTFVRPNVWTMDLDLLEQL